MSFVEVRLREDVERGAEGGPGFRTTVIPLASGHEQRNIDWEFERGEWDLAYGITDKVTYSEVLAFFRARRGRAIGFRFKDFVDYQLDEASQFAVGNGTATKFQLYKWYGGFGTGYRRPIQKPVTGTVGIYVGGVLQPSGVSVNYTNGVVTFEAAPAGGAVISADGEFDVPVRFNIDTLRANVVWENAASFPNIPVIEIRQPFGSLA
jgi:uncharacterized protein (TIGR02217 family)